MLVLRRLAIALPSVAGVIIVTFLLTRALPGDPAVYFAGPAATQQAIAEIRHLMGFDRSLPVQFLDYLRHLAHGDLGTSLTTGQPVLSELADTASGLGRADIVCIVAVDRHRSTARHRGGIASRLAG